MIVNLVVDIRCPIWLNSFHVRRLDAQLNEAVKTVTGIEWLHVLSNSVF